ncbi:MAG TPA: carbamoyltransferase HypF [Mycobacteriales bacterium]
MRIRFRVEGVVQGVGFRPFVHAVAHRHRLGGLVGNDTAGVFIEVEGPAAQVGAFRSALEREAPPLAVVERVTAEEVAARGETDFVIVPSAPGGERQTLLAPDTATCADCLRELWDPADRRHRYPFTNCTNCGPRFTIIRDVPYDRPTTTMASFAMCGDCAREYHDPADRRFHAQPTCCPVCGPALALHDRDGKPVEGEPIATTARLLAEGQVLAVKGLGGFHLAADAAHEGAVAALRSRKHRADKPFALMVPDVGAARRVGHLSPEEERLLTGASRPIVMLRRTPDAPVAAQVAPGNHFLGVMLPYTPLHHLLLAEHGRPLVLTSGNVSDEPIAYLDADAAERLGPIADAVLTHDRPIHIRTDDSVTRVWRGREYPIRRSRGYVPRPLSLPWAFRRPVLACGAELKNTFALGKGHHAFVSHHIGDLENYETYRSFTEGIAHFTRLFDVEPALVAHDLHPEYLSTKYARELDGAEVLGVQHHHAHIAACLADNGEAGPVIGVAFDGLGMGTDGTIWGGEFLVADLTGFTRHGHLAPVPMPGGTAAVKQPWRMAAAHLAAAGLEPPGDLLARHSGTWETVLAVARAGANSPLTSSAGRLFDAVAAIVGVRDEINYEGQAAVELEQLADRGERGAYPAGLESAEGEGPFVVRCADLVQAVVEDLGSGPSTVAARFHNGVAAAIAAGAARVREATGLDTVALSGGVFQNLLLLDATADALAAREFRVLTHHRVPTNDGGLSLGQAAVAGAVDRSP